MEKITDEKAKGQSMELSADDKGKSRKRRCFVIMPFSERDGYDPGHFSRVYDYLIKPACEQAGFEAVRGDSNNKSDFIALEIVRQIVECDMALCDLSSRNPNVFYELGLRHAFDLKTVLMMDDKTERPFDVSGIRTLRYNSSLRVDEVKNSINEIAQSLKSTYEQQEKDGNSLIQLLPVSGPAKLPEGKELNADTSIILNEISNLRFELQQMRAREPVFAKPKPLLRLPNGEQASLGTKFYHKSDLPFFEEYGSLIGRNPKGYEIQTPNGLISLIPDDPEAWKDITTKDNSLGI